MSWIIAKTIIMVLNQQMHIRINFAREEKEMEMTNEEIIQSYRQSKDPQKQIKILAQLNACEAADIENIIKRSESMSANPTPNFEEIKRLYEKGLHDNEIARNAGCAPCTVYRWRKKNGLLAHPWKKADGTPARKPKQAEGTQNKEADTDLNWGATKLEVVPNDVLEYRINNNVSDTFGRIDNLITTIKKDDSPEIVQSYKTLIKKIFEDGLNGYFNKFGSL